MFFCSQYSTPPVDMLWKDRTIWTTYYVAQREGDRLQHTAVLFYGYVGFETSLLTDQSLTAMRGCRRRSKSQ